MISDYRKQKLLHLFNVFFDTDSSGSVEKNDFELAASNIAKARGWRVGGDKYKDILDSLLKIWDGLQNSADADKDGKVTAEEWVSMWENFSDDPTASADWQKQFCRVMFQLEDAGGDGSIDREEFASVFESFGLIKEDAEAAFTVISNGETTVSWERFQDLWNQYFTSDDCHEPGNYIFGAATF
ncbi:sarcoplasmic calcium-binding proteins II, V, VI, and VII-like [Battus philenor]|uniref:sarcoplasmic calcium-binding proteins II, V, VI, and VII-like n=1 Tax=Battus philenor TaxID=42288 RepID=UPI0035CEA0C3